MRFTPIRELDMTGKFMQLHTLNLDSSIHLTSFQMNCFSCMPKLRQLSVCATRVSNLWTTTAALTKLPSLVELRFQSCLCCYGTGPCPKSGGGSITSYEKTRVDQQRQHTDARKLSFGTENFLLENLQYISGESPSDLYSDADSDPNHVLLQNTVEEPSDGGDSDFSSNRPAVTDWEETRRSATPEFEVQATSSAFEHDTLFTSNSSPHASYQLIEEIAYSSIGIRNGISEIDESEVQNYNNKGNGHTSLSEFSGQLSFSNHYFARKFSNEHQGGYSDNMLETEDTAGTPESTSERPSLHHPSPICFEKYYREYMISSLAQLEVLDNFSVKDLERKKANATIKKHYEYLPYNRHFKESVISILQKREVGTIGAYKYSHSKAPRPRGCCHSYTRSLAAAKVSSCTWPHFYSASKFISRMEGIEPFRPRQFEYHPHDASLMVFGTLNGELVVINHESQKLVGYLPSVGAFHSILGLCWLKKYPSKVSWSWGWHKFSTVFCIYLMSILHSICRLFSSLFPFKKKEDKSLDSDVLLLPSN